MHYVLTFGRTRPPEYFHTKADLLLFISQIDCFLSDKMRSRIRIWRCPYGFDQFFNLISDYASEDLPPSFFVSTLKNFL